MKKLRKYIGVLAVALIALFTLASCNDDDSLTMVEKFNQANIALPEDNNFTEISVSDITTSISETADKEVVVLVYSSATSSSASYVKAIDELATQYDEYGKQAYQTEVEFKLFFVDSTDLSDSDKDDFITNTGATGNSDIVEKDFVVLTYVYDAGSKTHELDLNTSLSEWSSESVAKMNSQIFTFQIGEKLKALIED